MPEEQLPQLATNPYPAQYVSTWTAANGMQVLFRPIRPDDEKAMAKFHEMLSDRSVYLRYFHMEKLSSRVAHTRLMSRCVIDYDQEMALVSDWTNSDTAEHEIIAVGRLTRESMGSDGEIAAIVADRFQHQGLGSEMLRRLIQIARDKKIVQITASILLENVGMRALVKQFGFDVQSGEDPTVVRAVLNL